MALTGRPASGRSASSAPAPSGRGTIGSSGRSPPPAAPQDQALFSAGRPQTRPGYSTDQDASRSLLTSVATALESSGGTLLPTRAHCWPKVPARWKPSGNEARALISRMVGLRVSVRSRSSYPVLIREIVAAGSSAGIQGLIFCNLVASNRGMTALTGIGSYAG